VWSFVEKSKRALEKGRGPSGKKVRGRWRNGVILRRRKYEGAGERAWSFGEQSEMALEKTA
jgi:hypothetical protein